jgi:diadenosine tetraphosphatase ApaH/serine/threonine PP2A family protein phosphatase
MKAIISDVHANLEALQAVLGDIAKLNVAQVYCLGDVVGYGPNPRECIDLLLGCKVVLLGNHDEAARTGPVGFNPAATRTLWWTRQQLQDTKDPARVALKRWKFLGDMMQSHKENEFLFVHASPRDPIREYVFPEDVYNTPKMREIFALVEHYCFMGHTHIPGIITEAREFKSPEEFGSAYRLGSGKLLCNVGSVGQPRDGDLRACYVLLDDKKITFRRVSYDIETTVGKIRANPDLKDLIGYFVKE